MVADSNSTQRKLKQATIDKFAWEISFSLVVAQNAVARGDVAYAAGCCFRSVACMNQGLFALNEAYLLNEKGAVGLANSFTLCAADYLRRVESVFTLLATDAESIRGAIAILDEIERELSQWYGDRRLTNAKHDGFWSSVICPSSEYHAVKGNCRV
jgi:hypothetical protein